MKINPFSKGKTTKQQWATVTDRVNSIQFALSTRKVNLRQTRERATMLLETFQAKEKKSKRDSGVDEEHDEKDDLLNEWIELIDEMTMKNEDVEDERRKLKDGLKIREAAMTSLTMSPRKKPVLAKIDLNASESESSDDDQPPKLESYCDKGRKRPLKKSGAGKKRHKADETSEIMSYLAKQNELREKELALEKSRIEMESEKSNAMNQVLMKLVEKLSKD